MAPKHTLSLALSLAIGTLGWIVTDRYLLGRPWQQVRHGAVAVALGFLVVHLLIVRIEQNKRQDDRKHEHRK